MSSRLGKRKRQELARKAAKERGQQEVSEKTPEEPTEERRGLTLLSRRNAIISLGVTGAAIVADRLGLFKFFGKGKNEEPKQKKVPEKRIITPKTPEYEEWVSKIELPEVELSDEPLNWTEKERKKYFMKFVENPEEVDLEGFYNAFLASKEKALSEIKLSIREDEKRQVVRNFMISLLDHYDHFVPKKLQKKLPTTKSITGAWQVCVNSLLIPNNAYIDILTGNNTFLHFAIYDVVSEGKMHIQVDENELDLPVLFLDRSQDLFKPETASALGWYHAEGKYIIAKKSMQNPSKFYQRKILRAQPIDEGLMTQDYFRSILSHEGAHAAFSLINGDQVKVNKRGDINMGRYSLKESEYRTADKNSLHELFACGIGITKMGDSVAYIIIDTFVNQLADPSYIFVAHIFFKELMASPHLDDEIYEKYLKNQTALDSAGYSKLKGSIVGKTMRKIPNEELHRIGERMAKLGLYLTQED